MTEVVEEVEFTLELFGEMSGHTDIITCISTNTQNKITTIVSSSEDNNLIVWKQDEDFDEKRYATQVRTLHGHEDVVTCCEISKDGKTVISSSNDKTLRLWNIEDNRFEDPKIYYGHTREIQSVGFSNDSLEFVSSGNDRTIKIWNKVDDTPIIDIRNAHGQPISTICFTPETNPCIVYGGIDNIVKITNRVNKNFSFKTSIKGFSDSRNISDTINSAIISPDASLLAIGGKGGEIELFDFEKEKKIYSLLTYEEIHDLKFSPTRYWVCSAGDKFIQIIDLEEKAHVASLEAKPLKGQKPPVCRCICFNDDGNTLFSGHDDHIIRVWKVGPKIK